MLRIVSWIAALAVVVAAVVIALANRHGVVFSLDPFPIEVQLPLYVVVFAGVFVGLLLGGLASTLSFMKKRRRRPAPAPDQDTPAVR